MLLSTKPAHWHSGLLRAQNGRKKPDVPTSAAAKRQGKLSSSGTKLHLIFMGTNQEISLPLPSTACHQLRLERVGKLSNTARQKITDKTETPCLTCMNLVRQLRKNNKDVLWTVIFLRELKRWSRFETPVAEFTVRTRVNLPPPLGVSNVLITWNKKSFLALFCELAWEYYVSVPANIQKTILAEK